MTDAVVIGAGPDELVAAHLLADAGRRVTVVQEHRPSERATGWVPPEVLAALKLQGFVAKRPDPWLRAPLPDGGTLELTQDMARSVENLRRISPRDADKWPLFCERLARLAALLARLYVGPAPKLVDMRFALRVRRLGRQGMEDLMRILPMPVAELLDDWFESDALKGALGALAVRDLQQGPRSAGTAFGLLHFHTGAPAGVFRPLSSNLPALLHARHGLTLREGRVARIVVRAGEAAAVQLNDGTELAAGLVVAGAEPNRVLGELVEPGWIDPDLLRALRNIRRRGVTARVRLDLERAPAWQTLTLAPSLDYLERAYDDAKYGRISAQPALDAIADGPSAEVRFQYAPYSLADGGWNEARGAGIGALAAKLLGARLPAVKRTSAQSPADLERLEGWPQGQPHHAELSLDQALWMRPLPELARYRTPIKGVWLCGPAMHPGAGVVGAAGYNCAREILRS